MSSSASSRCQLQAKYQAVKAFKRCVESINSRAEELLEVTIQNVDPDKIDTMVHLTLQMLDEASKCLRRTIDVEKSELQISNPGQSECRSQQVFPDTDSKIADHEEWIQDESLSKACTPPSESSDIILAFRGESTDSKQFKPVTFHLSKSTCSATTQIAKSSAADARSAPIEVIEDRLYFTVCDSPPKERQGEHVFCTDLEMQYTPFCKDFGPLNLGMTHAFCTKLKGILSDPLLAQHRIIYYTANSSDLKCSSNAVYLLGAFLVLHLGRTPAEAWAPFSRISPPPCRPFRDASWAPRQHDLHVRDCWGALIRAATQGLYSRSRFDADEYFYYDNPSNGDIHEVVRGKFLAFRTPLRPCAYIKVFRTKGVTAVVSLGRREYRSSEVLREGFEHFDLECEDGGAAPPDAVTARFLEIADRAGGAVAVHCHSGLGSAGTLIAAYLIARRQFTADEAIAWVRICRPGSVIGAQQLYLKALEARVARGG